MFAYPSARSIIRHPPDSGRRSVYIVMHQKLPTSVSRSAPPPYGHSNLTRHLLRERLLSLPILFVIYLFCAGYNPNLLKAPRSFFRHSGPLKKTQKKTCLYVICYVCLHDHDQMNIWLGLVISSYDFSYFRIPLLLISNSHFSPPKVFSSFVQLLFVFSFMLQFLHWQYAICLHQPV